MRAIRDPGGRSIDRLRAHWEIERELADRLRTATREQRTTLYGAVYDELFRRVPDHPQLVQKADQARRRAAAQRQARMVRGFLPERGVFLEIGAGDCALSRAMAEWASQVYAVEVSQEIAETEGAPGNFHLVITDGRQIPIKPATVDLAYTNQLLEHLHPEDAVEHVRNVFASLRSGGRYICLTPNRILGPGDISQYFEDEIANGFHLREYSNRELRDLLRSEGFASVRVIASLRGHTTALPIVPFIVLESLFGRLPLRMRRRLKRTRPVQKLLSPGGGVIAATPGR